MVPRLGVRHLLIAELRSAMTRLLDARSFWDSSSLFGSAQRFGSSGRLGRVPEPSTTVARCRNLLRHLEHSASSGVHHGEENSSGRSLPRCAGSVIVLRQQHDDVVDVARATSTTAPTVSYGSTSDAFSNLPLRRARSGFWPLVRGVDRSAVHCGRLGVPGRMGTMVPMVPWYGTLPTPGTHGTDPPRALPGPWEPPSASVRQRLAAGKQPVLVTFWSLSGTFRIPTKQTRECFSAFPGKARSQPNQTKSILIRKSRFPGCRHPGNTCFRDS